MMIIHWKNFLWCRFPLPLRQGNKMRIAIWGCLKNWCRWMKVNFFSQREAATRDENVSSSRNFFRRQFFLEIITGASAIGTVQKSSKSELSSWLFGHLKFLAETPGTPCAKYPFVFRWFLFFRRGATRMSAPRKIWVAVWWSKIWTKFGNSE